MKRGRISRTAEQQEYFDNHQMCEICGRPASHVHHINQNRRDDREENLFSLCHDHHVGERGIHTLGAVRYCETNLLTKNPKWKDRYEIAKGKEQLRRGINE